MSSIFDFNIRDLIFHEDDGSDIINGGDANGGGDQGSDQGGDNGGDAEESGGDDEFNIDTSVDDEGGNDEGGEDSGDDSGGDDSSSDDSFGDDGGMGGGMDGDGEPLPENNDVFVTLTAEEQQVKIMELKKLFNELYIYTDDLLKKMNDLDIEEDTLEVISRTSSQLYQLKIYMRDYMTNTFNNKSFVENDVYFNRFSAIIYSIGNIVDRLVVKRREKLGIEDDDE